MTRMFQRAAVLLWLCLGPAGVFAGPPAESSPWTGPFFFIQMADPQLGMFAGNADFKKETELLTKAIRHANRLKPAFVVVCGDLINQPGDDAQAAEFQRITGMLDKGIRLHLVAGNHEVHNVPTRDSLTWYRRTFGRDRYAFTQSGCRFIVLNSTIIHRPDEVENEMQRQQTWLTTELKASQESKPVHTIVFQHHPYFVGEPDEPDAYANIPSPRRQDYLKLLDDAGVTAVFAGHFHRNSLGRYRGVEMVTTGPVGKPLGEDPSGLRIVKVYRDHIEHAYYGLEAVPQRVELKAPPAGGERPTSRPASTAPAGAAMPPTRLSPVRHLLARQGFTLAPEAGSETPRPGGKRS